MGSTAEVTQAGTRLDAAGLAAEPEPGAICCYALQDKVWAHDPAGLASGVLRRAGAYREA